MALDMANMTVDQLQAIVDNPSTLDSVRDLARDRITQLNNQAGTSSNSSGSSNFGVTRTASDIANQNSGGSGSSFYSSLDSNSAPFIYYQDATSGPGIKMYDIANDTETLDPYSQLIRGTLSFSPDRLKEIDPAYTGHTHVFVLRMPPVLTIPADSNGQLSGFEGASATSSGLAAAHARNLKLLFEMGSTAYSGTPELTLNTTDVNVGWNDRNYAVPTFSEYGSNTFTIRCIELRGNKLQRGCEYLINGVSDVGLKGSHMNGAVYSNTPLAMSLTNFTWTILVVQTDPTRINIQDISLWANALITNVDNSNFDWEEGQVDIVQPREVQLRGNYIQATQIPIFQHAAKLLLQRRLKYYMRYRDMDANMFGVSSWSNWGTTGAALPTGIV